MTTAITTTTRPSFTVRRRGILGALAAASLVGAGAIALIVVRDDDSTPAPVPATVGVSSNLTGSFTNAAGAVNLGPRVSRDMNLTGSFTNAAGAVNVGPSSGPSRNLTGSFTNAAGAVNVGSRACSADDDC
jgi:hypothetical protein